MSLFDPFNLISSSPDDLTGDNFLIIDYRRGIIKFSPRIWDISVFIPNDDKQLPQVRSFVWKRVINKINWIIAKLCKKEKKANLILNRLNDGRYDLSLEMTDEKFPSNDFIRDLGVDQYFKKKIDECAFEFSSKHVLSVVDDESKSFHESFFNDSICELIFSGVNRKMQVEVTSPFTILAEVAIVPELNRIM